jgi:hypothetical protein
MVAAKSHLSGYNFLAMTYLSKVQDQED